jgi:hypothetical protein
MGATHLQGVIEIKTYRPLEIFQKSIAFAML